MRLPPPIAPQGKRSSEHLENMQRLFPGVHGRVIELCKPSQKKYNAAVTIAMGKNMDAIVVDNEATAQDCIRYLKEKKGAPETFVPLDTIRTTPIAERCRCLGGSKRPVIDATSNPHPKANSNRNRNPNPHPHPHPHPNPHSNPSPLP